MNRASVTILAAGLAFGCIAAAEGQDRLPNKIAFLKGGEIWTSDIDGRRMEKLTATGGKIEAFLFSPTLRYLV